jgi:hypothetical protein
LSPGFQPIAPAELVSRLAAWLAESTGTVRVAIDGPPCAEPAALAESLIDPLRALSRPAAHVRASSFWRDASVRLEFGREDVAAYRDWLDAGALCREVLEPVVVADGSYLPSLRDPDTNRSTREPPVSAPVRTVLIVSGELLLGRGLPFDRTVHLALSRGARARRTPAAQVWTLPAFDAYDAEVRPAETADVVLRLDDPRHPAIAVR